MVRLAAPRRCQSLRVVFCTSAVSPQGHGRKPKREPKVVNGWTVNKQTMLKHISDELYGYVLDHTREPEVLAELREETARLPGFQMQVSPEQGQLMGLLVQLMGVKKAIEVGVFTGYSSLCVAMALPPDGKLVALERDEKALSVARRYWDKAGVTHKVVERVGKAESTLQSIIKEEGGNSYDFAFIDADKANYGVYYELALELVRPGGLVIVDNVLFNGKVVDPEVKDRGTNAIRALNDKIFKDDRVFTATLTVADGLTLCRKL
ncbi:unnamed protein product [Ostreobium quekettii]|uniref:O-methyltransferase n=1 Tax=Ostreobium quekettii TaxID=121088 RepID=A0A8S1IY52_9CHLO|nr:unnamed protein product [Ostreobium quekettii]